MATERRQRPYREEPARIPLIALSTATSVAVVTGTFTYAYPETLAAVRPQMLWVHELSGDAMIVSAAVYLVIHLKRTWRLRKLALSWWTGLLVAAVLAVCAASGVAGQLSELSVTWYWAHVVSSVIVVAGACFHSAYGLMRRLR